MDTAFVTVWYAAGILAGCVVALLLLIAVVALFRFIRDILFDL